MAATAEDYLPILFSEKVTKNANGKYTACRPASLAMMFDACTLGDWTTNPNGSEWAGAKVKQAIEAMMDATGHPNSKGFNQTDVPAMLRAIKAPQDSWEKRNKGFATLKQDLKDNFTVDLAGDVAGTRAGSPLRQYVNPDVGHNIILVDIRSATGKIGFIDPMTPMNAARQQQVRWAPYQDFKDFGARFKFGGSNYVYGRSKKGKHSRVREAQKASAAIVLDVQQKLAKTQASLRRTERELTACEVQVEQLEIDLAECHIADGDIDVARRAMTDAITTLEDGLADTD